MLSGYPHMSLFRPGIQVLGLMLSGYPHMSLFRPGIQVLGKYSVVTLHTSIFIPGAKVPVVDLVIVSVCLCVWECELVIMSDAQIFSTVAKT